MKLSIYFMQTGAHMSIFFFSVWQHNNILKLNQRNGTGTMHANCFRVNRSPLQSSATIVTQCNPTVLLWLPLIACIDSLMTLLLVFFKRATSLRGSLLFICWSFILLFSHPLSSSLSSFTHMHKQMGISKKLKPYFWLSIKPFLFFPFFSLPPKLLAKNRAIYDSKADWTRQYTHSLLAISSNEMRGVSPLVFDVIQVYF